MVGVEVGVGVVVEGVVEVGVVVEVVVGVGVEVEGGVVVVVGVGLVVGVVVVVVVEVGVVSHLIDAALEHGARIICAVDGAPMDKQIVNEKGRWAPYTGRWAHHNKEMHEYHVTEYVTDEEATR